MVSVAGRCSYYQRSLVGFAGNPLDLGRGCHHLLARTDCRKIYLHIVGHGKKLALEI